MSTTADDRRTRRRLLEAAVALLERGALPGHLVEDAARACGCSVERARVFFRRDEEVVLALYQRIAHDLEARVAELPEGGTLSQRFHAAVEAKLALVAPYRGAFAALLASALDPRHELGVLGERTEIVRDQVRRFFSAVVLGAADHPADPALAEQVVRVLYALHLALLLVWTQDRSEDRAAARVATDLARDLLAAGGPLLASPLAIGALGRVDGFLGRLVGGAPDPARDELATWILRVIFRHRRLLPGAGPCSAEPCERCFALHLPRVRRYLAANEPIHMLLPAFPAKSPSPRKTLGPLPDLAEERALEHLQSVCDEIATLHPPGARITICSDGHVFSDLVGVSDADVTRYGAAIVEIISRRGLRSLERFGLEDLYEDAPGESIRAELLGHYGEPVEAVAKRCREHEHARALWNGMQRFLFEDRIAVETGKSRTQVRNECKDRAYSVIQRSNAWSRLVSDCFPSALRLSIHPQGPHSEKIGFLLGPSDDPWLTPWHGVALAGETSWRLVPRHEAEALGARVVDRDGRPSHFALEVASGGPALRFEPLLPFGLRVLARGESLASVPRDAIERWLLEHRVLVLAGFEPLDRDAFVRFAEGLGEVLEWEFGSVNELVAKDGAKNYLYTNAAVPFHWDGAFVGRIPRAILFRCVEAPAPGSGGETLFADTTRLLARASAEQKERWARTRVTYSTEKVVHYGGSFTSPVLARHPVTGEPIVRFAEPVNDLNPVSLSIDGDGPLVEEMGALLRDPAVLHGHSWRTGDIVLADNHALLHGRNAFAAGARRRIERVNVL